MMLEITRGADEHRSYWFASTRWGVQAYPVTWQGWLLTLGYTIFILAMVGAADAVGKGPYVFAIVIYRHLRPRHQTKG